MLSDAHRTFTSPTLQVSLPASLPNSLRLPPIDEPLSVHDEVQLRLGRWSERPSRCWRLSHLHSVPGELLVMRVHTLAKRSRWFVQNASGILLDVVHLDAGSYLKWYAVVSSYFSVWLSECSAPRASRIKNAAHQVVREQLVEVVSKCLLQLRARGFDLALADHDRIQSFYPAPVFSATRGVTLNGRSVVLWPGKRGQDVANVIGYVAAADANDRSWEAKRNVACFRGSPNGLVSHAGRQQTPSRVQVLEAARGDVLFDAKLSRPGWRRDPTDYWSQVARAWNMTTQQAQARVQALQADYMNMTVQLSHKAILSIEGNGFATNLGWVLASNSVLVMAHADEHGPDLGGGYQETVSHLGLMPWQHFVPFSFNLADLHLNVAWCFAHDNECHSIAQRGRALQRRMLNQTRERIVQRLVLERVVAWQCDDETSSADVMRTPPASRQPPPAMLRNTTSPKQFACLLQLYHGQQSYCSSQKNHTHMQKGLKRLGGFNMTSIFYGHDVYAGLALRDFDLYGWHVFGCLYTQLICRLKDAASQVVVEVGVWKGATTAVFASALRSFMPEVKVIAVDSWLGDTSMWQAMGQNVSRRAEQGFRVDLQLVNGYPTVYYTFLSNMVQLGLQDQVVPLPLPSTMAAHRLATILHAIYTPDQCCIGLLHLDGSHNYEEVLADLKAWWPLMSPGGMLLGDDWGWRGVQKAAIDFAAQQQVSISRPGGAESPKWMLVKPSMLAPTE